MCGAWGVGQGSQGGITPSLDSFVCFVWHSEVISGFQPWVPGSGNSLHVTENVGGRKGVGLFQARENEGMQRGGGWHGLVST